MSKEFFSFCVNISCTKTRKHSKRKKRKLDEDTTIVCYVSIKDPLFSRRHLENRWRYLDWFQVLGICTLQTSLKYAGRYWSLLGAMLEGKVVIIPALGHKKKETWTSEAWLAFVLMSQCENKNELALQHGGFCTTWSLAAKGLFLVLVFPSCSMESCEDISLSIK